MARPSFFAELQRRNVHRAALFYAGAAWLLMQIASQIFPFFDIPNWAVRVVVVTLLIGFPFAMLFSWFYEWTPQGIKRESEVDRSQSVTRQTGRTLDRWIIGVLSLAVVVLLLNQFVLHRFMPAVPSKENAASDAIEKSIAVLPLANSTGDPANEYFSDGVSEELISSLSRLSNLRVVGRTSSFQFKGKSDDSKTIGEKLGVVYLLEGSVRKSTDRVRIAVALVKSANGSSVWSETYDRELKDIFAVQSEIAGAVAEQLKVALLGNNVQTAQAPTAATPSNQNLAAYNAYLQGEFHRRRSTAEDYRKAIGYFDEAIRLDPNYALAYARLAQAKTQLVTQVSGPEGQEGRAMLAEARAAADTALRLAPGLAEAHLARGIILQSVDLDPAGARAEIYRAVELAPQNPVAVRSLALQYGKEGRFEEALETARKAFALDPLNYATHTTLGNALAALGRDDEAETVIRKALELQPQAAQIRSQLMNIEIRRGNGAAAVALAQQETDPFWQTYSLAMAHFVSASESLTRVWHRMD